MSPVDPYIPGSRGSAGLGLGQTLALWLLGISVGCLLVAGCPLLGWDAQGGAGVQEGLGMMAASAVGLKVADLGWGGAWGPPAGGWRAAAGQAGSSYAIYFAMGVFAWCLMPDASGTGAEADSLFCALVVAPAVEEILFRGVLQPALSLRCGRLAGILLPALLFGLGHPGLTRFAPASVFGLLSGLLRERTGSLLPCIALHLATNVLAVAVQADSILLGPGLLGVLVATLWGLAGARGYLRARRA